MEKTEKIVPDITAVKRTYFNGQYLAELFQDFQKYIDDFEVRDTDVWLCCFPKTGKTNLYFYLPKNVLVRFTNAILQILGSTWLHEMIWLVMNDYNYEAAKEYPETRTPFLE